MERTYTVEGRWPFPTDMLRHDQARAATPEDAALIERLSGASSDNGFGLDGKIKVNLVIDHSGEPWTGRPHGRWMPNLARWESFDWKVIDGDDYLKRDILLYEKILAERANAAREKELVKTALAKLTPEEQDLFTVLLKKYNG